MTPLPESSVPYPGPDPTGEVRVDPAGNPWWLLREPFTRYDGQRVVQATRGEEVQGTMAVRYDLHIPADEWFSWEAIA